jgi:YidC/Oxa1 family membrane protein insertase
MLDFIKSIFAPIIKFIKPVIYIPLLNILIFTYYYVPDLGIAIILLTLVIRLLMLPSFHKSLKQQKMMQALQPKINEIREKYKTDKQAEMKAMMELYRENDVNPLGSCSTLLIQLPILFALSTLFTRIGNQDVVKDLYNFVPHPAEINTYFLGFIDLAAKNNYILVGSAAALQFVQTKLTMPKHKSTDAMQNTMQNSMLYFFPVMLFVSILALPAALALYIIITTLFSVGQQYYILRQEAKESL